MRIAPKFPRSRMDIPMRRAEYTIYQILRDTQMRGRALYEARVSPEAREVDFTVWLEGVARYAIEVKGGRYEIDADGWNLITGGGRYPKPSPVSQAREAAMSIPAIIEEQSYARARPVQRRLTGESAPAVTALHLKLVHSDIMPVSGLCRGD